ncbi:hypothetical protein U9M48_030872 [Paspalum notatum var. saurae]|uniref:No apical meristem-associated C-terminal domain-containing protein n=1 Tax=Paspalum notatum var. saurae TaxID=547442 RepID=A0AAQ3U4I9_PASNO
MPIPFRVMTVLRPSFRHSTIKDACDRFKEFKKKDFQFLHCWHVLRGTRKWEDYVEKMLTKRKAYGQGQGKKDAQLRCYTYIRSRCTVNIPKNGGIKRTKTEATDPMDTGHQIFQERQLEIQDREARAKERHYERQANIQERQLQVQVEQWEWTKRQDENKIMLMDLHNVSETAKEYFLNMQQDILQLQRRGGGSSFIQ